MERYDGSGTPVAAMRSEAVEAWEMQEKTMTELKMVLNTLRERLVRVLRPENAMATPPSSRLSSPIQLQAPGLDNIKRNTEIGQECLEVAKDLMDRLQF